RRDLASGDARWYWAAAGSLFYGNDPAGTVLSWRGWSINNWQTAWGGDIALADLPVFAFAPQQAPVSEPFLELDGAPGYYSWAELGLARSLRVRALYYDNRADPDAGTRPVRLAHHVHVARRAARPAAGRRPDR